MVTTTFPVVAAAGTTTFMLVSLHSDTTASAPLNVTLPVPCEEPKLDPVIVTADPVGPEVGDKLLIVGKTLNGTALLLKRLAFVTTTFPEVAPFGTVTEMSVSLQVCTVALVPLNVTPPKLPGDEPKPVP